MKATPFLMFQGQAKDALALWQSAVPGFEVLELNEHPEGDMAGQVMTARIRIGGAEWLVNDSPPVHNFSFTPSTSIFVECDDEAQLRDMAEKLTASVMMPIDNYGFSRLFTWIADPFNISWQLNLPE
ncbi:VOC family protein [Aurantiacibacter sp. MUD11]|uniref:VOC family protein n=1 Tax=Aurantiacibacter sp. MUD11 TaxID=3003265 RepID=UPI0022AAA16B|nr:VOC family protein [Aurantiacibacter sp. MUD11]WAT18082.1 VOC family protein [Aurantiacibacter sp. MUD11]